MIACVGGGSNAIGIFTAFLDDEEVELIGVEAGGEGIDTPRHGAPLTVGGRAGHPARLALGGDAGRGGPDRRGALDLRRARLPGDRSRSTPSCATAAARATSPCTDEQALRAFSEVARLEGIIPALETAHALAWVLAQDGGDLDLICLSGRGDKDLAEVLGADGDA